MAEQFATQIVIFGVGGLDLKRSIDLIPAVKLARMTNVVRDEEGSLTSRPGQTEVASAPGSGEIHSLTRLNTGSSFDRLAGVGTELYCGMTGVLTLVEGGFSGSPLTFAAAHPPISSDTWAYIGDTAKMRKVRASDCLDLAIGLTSPPATDLDFPLDDFTWPTPATWAARDLTRLCCYGFDIVGIGPGAPGDYTAYATQNKKTIDTCDAAGWTNNAGSGGAPSNTTDAVNKKEGTASLKLTTNAGAGAYYNFWNKANPLNLNSFGNGVLATDDDIVHLWLRTDRPDKILEIRLYFVVSSSFNTGTLPGTSDTNNTDAYMKAFRPIDFTSAYEASATTLGASSTANTNVQTTQQLSNIVDDRGGTVAIIQQQTDSSRAASTQFAPGRGAWTEFGIIGLPVHRRDFIRIGSDTTRSWGNVTGLVIAVQVSDTTSAINIWFDDIYLTGGAGLDSSLIGMQPYNYRHVNYDTRTGALSNPSPIQNIAFQLDSLRQGIVITPSAYGDSAIRQRFFRQGGSLVNNWYFVGQNTSDGAPFTDTFSDLQALASGNVEGGLLELDNDQPITTVDSAGATVRAQPLPAIWGPINDILLGCGDPHRRGDVYWSKVLNYDSWPPSNHQEVCSPSEELMNGLILGSQGYVFSRERLFICYPNLQNAGTVTVLPTECTHGLLTRWSFTVGLGAIWFVAKDGIYRTAGGKEENISDNDIFSLFHGETKNGYLPIDFTALNSIRLEIFANDIWFLYRDTGGVNRIFIYSTIFQFWRAYNFNSEVSALYSEEGTLSNLLLGGRTSLKVYEHTGTSDDGAAIAANVRTGALDQGMPRETKLYGDIPIDAKGPGVSVTVTPLVDNETTTLPSQVIAPGAARTRFYVDVPDDQKGRNISIDLAWSSTTGGATVYSGGPSYTPQPDTATTRVTDKYVKGVVLEVDTFGVAKEVNVQADGATATTISVTASGRQLIQFSFSQFQGRILRLNPADTNPWILYSFQWIFDNEPLSLARWETQILNHDIPGQQTLTHSYLTVRNTATVNIEITTYRYDASTVVKNYSITTTGGKRLVFVPFEATAGVMFKYVFTSSAPFWLYRAESSVFIVPWGGDGVERKPFGDDDTDTTRGQVPPTLVKP
jgi:hypothetical protein